MEKEHELLLKKTEAFVKELLEKELPDYMYFHNFEHTLLVVEGIKLIGKQSNVAEIDLFLLTLAAFLHDVGYTEQYIGHELAGTEIARTFLLQNDLDPLQVGIITGLILATRYPQLPKNNLEEIICDADFYHFSLQNYIGFAEKLKKEWEESLHLLYNDREWDAINLDMLAGHQYFTGYGKKILQKKKNLNIEKLVQRFT